MNSMMREMVRVPLGESRLQRDIHRDLPVTARTQLSPATRYLIHSVIGSAPADKLD